MYALDFEETIIRLNILNDSTYLRLSLHVLTDFSNKSICKYRWGREKGWAVSTRVFMFPTNTSRVWGGNAFGIITSLSAFRQFYSIFQCVRFMGA